ncbi:MAG: hypothetical protein GEU74_07160 [Nitriliruptorales bacterium]|nr:hypothetical protein [Nitriliruptorales bacterium]
MAEQRLSQYDAEHIREALIHDERVSALDVQIRVSGPALVVTGTCRPRSAGGRLATSLRRWHPVLRSATT